MSEAFGGALPSAILAERDRLPVGLLDRILEDRYLARAIAHYRDHPKAEGLLMNLLRTIDLELAQEEIDAAHAE